MKPGDVITVDDWDVSDDWARGTLNGKTGVFYKAFTKPSSLVPSAEDFDSKEVRGKPEGYEVTYRGKDLVLSEKVDDAECVICDDLAYELRQSACCGKTLCSGCADKWKKTNDSCPQCREKPFEVIKDPRTMRKLTGTTVYCPMYTFGCDWVGNFGRLDQHAKSECPFEMVKCGDVNCKKKVPRRLLELHQTQLCQKRNVACPSCELNTRPGLLNPLPLRYSDIITKHYLECPMWPTRCPDACDPYLTLLRCDIAIHMKRCSEARTDCKFVAAGCRVRVKEEEMEDHLRDAKDNHLETVFELYKKVKEECDALRSRCKVLEKEHAALVSLRKEHKSLVEEHKEVKEERDKLKRILFSPLPHLHGHPLPLPENFPHFPLPENFHEHFHVERNHRH